MNSHGWIDKTKPYGDQLPSGAGLGPRVNFWVFLTRHGILEDENKDSVTTLTPVNYTMENRDIIQYIERGARALSLHPLARDKLKVICIDGAQINKMLPSDAILPTKMNVSDGGKNRPAMRYIGMAGLRRVLAAMGRDPSDLSATECRQNLWESDIVRSQLTQAEETAAKYGVILIYSPKSPPRFSVCEPYFRWVKRQLQNLFDMDMIKKRLIALDDSFTISRILPDGKQRLDKWFKSSQKYAEYFLKGGEKNIRENDMDSIDLNDIGRPLPPLLLVRDSKQLADMIHNCNWILIRGKHYPERPQPWSSPRDLEKRLDVGGQNSDSSH
jgi:hypothetical protein